jgi:hypothetical protein
MIVPTHVICRRAVECERNTGSISQADSGRLHEYTFATAALNLQDFSDMYVHLITSDLLRQ